MQKVRQCGEESLIGKAGTEERSWRGVVETRDRC